MSEDAELNQWRTEWQSRAIAVPEVRLPATAREIGGIARPHVGFLEDAIRSLRFQFWRRSERKFLADVLGDTADLRLHGRRTRGRRKVKGGLNI